jgi:HSP20 family protein
MGVFYMFGLIPYNKKDREIAGRYNPFDLRSVFDDFFSDSFMPAFFTSGNPIKADIRETEKEYVIDAEIPGVKKEDIKLDLRDDTLTISVEHSQESNEEKENYIRKERRYGSFSRSFYVENVKHEDVAAEYKDGILTIKLAKSPDSKPRSHSIDIQ